MLGEFITANNIAISFTLLIVAYFFIATEKIPKVTVALLGGAITVFLGLVSQNKMNGDLINPHYFVNFVDFNVIFLLVSMMIIVNISTKSGVFNWIANELLKLTKGHPISILAALGIFTAVVSAFLDNVTTVILIMPVTFFIAKKLEINPIPFLLTEVFASNIGGTATLIGDPPNIIIGSAAGFSFMDFVVNLTPAIAVILFAVTAVLAFIFKNKLKCFLATLLSHNTVKKVYARNCTIKQISNKEASVLNNSNHFQNHRDARLTYSLFYKNELIQLMSFSKHKKYEWEIIRSCSKANYLIVGGVSRLFTQFIRDNNPNQIFSYCDYNKFTGISYEKLGMKFVGNTVPDMKYIIGGQVVNRQPSNYQELKNKFDARIYGAGSKKYLWERQSYCKEREVKNK